MLAAMSQDIFPKNRWVPQHPDRLQLYSMATPNGKKVGIALEVMEVPYEGHFINIMEGDQRDPEFIKINPNSKIPAIIDPNGPGGEPVSMMESGAILLYLANKTGKLIPADERGKLEVTEWLMMQVGSIGPMFGQFGHFHKFARGKTADDYARERYTNEARRLLGVLDSRLNGRDFLVGGDMTIADVATFPWVMSFDFYEGKDAVDYESHKHVVSWVERCLAQPRVRDGMNVPARPA